MGKLFGFMEYDRKTMKSEEPLERIKHFGEFHRPLSRGRAGAPGGPVYGLRSSLLSGGSRYRRNDFRLPAK